MTSLENLVLDNPVPTSIVSTEPETLWENLSPIPPDAPKPNFLYGKYGKPSAIYSYKNNLGILRYICRYDFLDGSKFFLPLTLWQHKETGEFEWKCKDVSAPKSLYGLELLSSMPDAIVVVTEGEKACEAARKLLPDYIVITSSGGSNAANKSDWRVLKDRKVVIWPDADEAGKKYAESVYAELQKSGLSALLASPADGIKKGWDAADALQEGWTKEKATQFIEQAKPFLKKTYPNNFVVRGGFLYYREFDSNKPDIKISSVVEVIAHTRSNSGDNWGVLLEWRDKDGKIQRWAMPLEMLKGDGTDVIGQLLSRGLKIFSGKNVRQKLLDYIQSCDPIDKAISVEKIGWHGKNFVFPDIIIPASDYIFLQNDHQQDHAFRRAGNLKEWQDNIGCYASGNSRLILGICAAFAASLLHITGDEGGGFHLNGSSSLGKTTAINIASTVWGGGIPSYLKQWRTTDNGMELVAESHNHSLLCLDEFGQIDGRDAGNTAYMLANGSGKSRMRKTGGLRKVPQWKLYFLSSGETSLEEKMAEAGKKTYAGMENRFVDIPADAGVKFGIFENIHNFQSSAEFAKYLNEISRQYYGTPIIAFLNKLAVDDWGIISKLHSEIRKEFIGKFVPNNADGQVKRVGNRFAHVALGGILAVRYGIFPVTEEDVIAGLGKCFKDWLEKRGTYGDAEIYKGLLQVVEFLKKHDTTRFANVNDIGRDMEEILSADSREKTINQAGFKKRNQDGELEYLIHPETFRREICKGCNHKSIADALFERNLISRDSQGRYDVVKHISGYAKKIRFFVIPAKIFEVIT